MDNIDCIILIQSTTLLLSRHKLHEMFSTKKFLSTIKQTAKISLNEFKVMMTIFLVLINAGKLLIHRENKK